MMKNKIALDIEGLSLEDHRAVVEKVQAICSQLEVLETDRRTEKPIDAQFVGLVIETVSAICAVIGLVIRSRQSKRKNAPPHKKDTGSTISYVESQLGLELSDEIKETLIRSLSTQQLPDKMIFTLCKKKYSITIYEEHDFLFLKGRYMGDED